jgi:hypothetical protein
MQCRAFFRDRAARVAVAFGQIIVERRLPAPALSFFDTQGAKTDAENPQVNR